MSDIADEFKIVVVEAVRTLCLKFPAKHRVLMNFLSTVLREDGGFEYKKAIVDSILVLIREIPEAKEAGLAHLCEFIEVCLCSCMPEGSWCSRARLQLKKANVDSMVVLIREISEAKEAGLAHLCGFIEVCLSSWVPERSWCSRTRLHCAFTSFDPSHGMVP